MNAPVSLRKGSVLLLAEPHSFSASYIRRSLDAFGVPVIAPSGPPSEALASLEPAEWLAVSACIAVDLGQSLFETLAAQHQQIPFVFVGQDPGSWFSGSYSWLSPPFAAFQVIEALGELVAASAAMQAAFGLAATDLLASGGRS